MSGGKTRMQNQKVILLAINLVGGIAVLGSYVLGINAQPGGADALWGGVPENIRLVYTASMLLAALGYFAFLYYILARLNPAETRIGSRFGFAVFYPVFVAILLPSALWMPLTNVYVSNPDMLTWLGVRLVLFIVAFGSLTLLAALLKIRTDAKSAARYLGIIGSAYFVFHTLVLDAIIWPVLFLS